MKSGRMIARGVGDLRPLISTPYDTSGSIGRIGRIFPTYARARGCGVYGCQPFGAERMEKVFLMRRSKTSSLSSLSSLKGCFTLKDQEVSVLGFGRIILPENQSILPILPEKTQATQNDVVIKETTTKS